MRAALGWSCTVPLLERRAPSRTAGWDNVHNFPLLHLSLPCGPTRATLCSSHFPHGWVQSHSHEAAMNSWPQGEPEKGVCIQRLGRQ